MNMISVDSSYLSAVGFDNGKLYVKFCTGVIYCYSGVPELVYSELIKAPSKGGYFADQIKDIYPGLQCDSI